MPTYNTHKQHETLLILPAGAKNTIFAKFIADAVFWRHSRHLQHHLCGGPTLGWFSKVCWVPILSAFFQASHRQDGASKEKSLGDCTSKSSCGGCRRIRDLRRAAAWWGPRQVRSHLFDLIQLGPEVCLLAPYCPFELGSHMRLYVPLLQQRGVEIFITRNHSEART